MAAPESTPDTAGTDGTDSTAGADDAPWPVVRRASARFVRGCRGVAVVALAYGLFVVLLALRDLTSSVWLVVGIVAGALVHLAGVAGLWFLAPRAPSRLAPRPGTPGYGTPAARAAARRSLCDGGSPDTEQRRLVALEVAGNARLPVVAAAAYALLGPVLVGAPNTDHPVVWLGPVVGALVVVVLVVLALQVRGARRLHTAALRADALPSVDGDEVPYLP